MKSTLLSASSIKYKLWLALLALAGAGLVLFATSRYGAGLTPDSVGYIGTARNLIMGTGFISYDGTPVVIWPPLYPVLLAFAGGIFGTDPLLLANVVHSIIFGLIVWTGGLLSFRHLSAFPALAFAGSLAVLFSIPLQAVSVVAYSEPLFILFVLLSLLYADSYLQKKALTPLILLSLSVALSCLTRYIGVMLIAWGAVVIFYFRRDGASLKSRWTHVLIFVCISVFPVGIWLVKNFVVSQTLVGTRASSIYSLAENLSFLFNGLLPWYFPGRIIRHPYILMIIGAVIVLSFGLTFKGGQQNVKAILRHIGPMALFVVAYLVFLVISSTTTAYDTIGDRLLSPVYVPLTLLFFILAQAFVQPLRKRIPGKTTDLILIICVLVWMIYPVRAVVLNAMYLSRNGQGYSSMVWRNSETVRYVLQHRADFAGRAYYTNDPYAAYFGAHLAAKTTPSKTEYNSPVTITDISELKGSWPEGNQACLFWFDLPDRTYLFSVRELQEIANITPVARLKDGTVYTVTKK